MVESVFDIVIDIFSTPITMYGFTFNFLNLFIYVCLAFIFALILGYILR